MSEASRTMTRLLTPDRPKFIRNIQIGVGDGFEDIFRVPILVICDGPDLTINLFNPDDSAYINGTISDFDYESGDVTLDAAPDAGLVVIAHFSYTVFSDTEVDTILARTEISDCPYLCAAVLVQSIRADSSRFISFTQGDTKYSFDKKMDALKDHIETLWKQSPLSGESIAVPFFPDYLSRIDYIPPPIVHFNTPYAKF